MEINAYFENIEDVIIEDIKTSKKQLLIATAWFTNKKIFDPIIDKLINCDDFAVKLIVIMTKDRKALAVVKDEQGRIVPAINNLNTNAVNYTDAINKQLLRTRRMAISPYDQFPTMARD